MGSRQNSGKGPADLSEQKDVHRFMKVTADLESEREVLLKSLKSIPETIPRNSDRVDIANNVWAQTVHRGVAGEKLLAGVSWVRNIATPQLEALSKQIMTKVSEADTSKKNNLKLNPSPGPM